MLRSERRLKGNVVGVCELLREIQVDAPRDSVWELVIDGINNWWKHGLAEGSQGVFLETRVGGRLWEKLDDHGRGILYGNVILIDKPNIISFSSTGGLAGVALGAGTWRFLDLGHQTLIEVQIELLSEFPERTMCGQLKQRISKLAQDLHNYVCSRALQVSEA